MARITQQDIAQYLKTGEAAPDVLPILQQYDPAYQVRQAAGTAQPTGGLLSAKPEQDGAGFWGTLREGAENTGRALAGAGNVLAGDGQALADKAKAQGEPSANPFLRAFYESISQGKQALGEDAGLLDSAGMVGSAIWSNPKGAAYAALEQLPNAAAVLAPAWAGMQGGALAGGAAGTVIPGVGNMAGAAVGGFVGGLAGMFLGNTALETGFKGIEAGADGELTDAERSQVLQEGAVKGAVLTGVDAVTLGASKFVTGATVRAVEQATKRTLIDRGVDVADAAAVQAARQTPEIVQAVQAAHKQAIATSNRLAPKMARGAAALGLETTGEGLGEYLGELAATGQGDMADAVLEAFLGLGQSVAEASWGAARNGAQLAKQTAFDKLEGARQQAAAQGGDALAQELAATEAASQSMQERLALPAPQQAAPIMVDRQGTAMTQADAERIALRPGMSFGRDELAQQVEQWDEQARNMRATRDPLRERQAGELEALATDGRAALLGYGDFQRGPAKATGLLGVLKERGYTPSSRAGQAQDWYGQQDQQAPAQQPAAGQYQLGEPAQPAGAEPSGLYRAMQVGREREQVRVDDFNTQVASIQREQLGAGEAPQYALPAGLELADKQGAGRFFNDTYRNGVDGLVNQLAEGGDVAYLKDAHGRITGRTASVNPTWWQNMDAKVKPGSIAEAKRVVQKALAGEKLGPKQARFISTMLDVVDDQRGLQQRNEQAAFQREQLQPEFDKSTAYNRFEYKNGGRRYEVSDEDQADLYDYLVGRVEPFDLAELEQADVDALYARLQVLDDTSEATRQAESLDDSDDYEGFIHGTERQAAGSGSQVSTQQGLPGEGRRNPEGGQAVPAGGQQAGRAEDRTESLTAPAADGLLQNYSEADLQARDDRQARATQAEASTRKVEADKAQADRERNDFTLTGSDRPADVAAARGQNDLFGASRHRDVEDAAHAAATSPHNDLAEPTEAQKAAGNYRKGHVTVQGLDLAIENPRGSERSGKRPDGSEWRHTMSDHYGYIKRSEGADGEQVDVYLGERPDSDRVFVIDQLEQQSGGFDEHKVMLGFNSTPQAVAAYRSNFDADWQLGPVTELSMEQFKEWLRSGDLSRPLGKKGFAVGDLQHLRQIVRQSNVPAKDAIAAARAAIRNPDRTATERQTLLEEVGATGAGSLAELNAALDKWWKRHFRERAAHKAKGKAEVEAFERQRREQDVEDTLALGRQAAAELDGRRADPVREVNQPAAEQPAAKPAKPKAAKPAKAKAKPLPKSYGEGNKLVTADRAEELRKKLLAKLGQVNSGIDPELVAIGTELAVFHIEAGARKFMDMARALADHLGVPMQSLRPYLRSWYNGARDMMEDTGHAVADMDDATTVRAQLAAMDALAADTLEPNNDESAADESGADGSVEQDRADADAGDRVGERFVSDDAERDGSGSGDAARADDQGRVQQYGDSRLSDDGALAGREPGDSGVRGEQSRAGDGAAGSADGGRGPALRGAGVADGREGRADAAGAAEQAVSHDSSLEHKRAAQREAAKLPVKAGDLENVRASLPFLLDLQQEDVHKTEQRFLAPEGYGMLLTNGTGTGKTYSGSGTIARSVYQGRDSVLVIAPSAVQQEWLTALDNLGVSAKLLASIKDNGGSGVVVTTHENAGQNDSLVNRQWDLVVVDESHKLLENLQGEPTLALKTLRAVTMHPRGAYSRARQLRADDYARLKELRSQIDANSKMLNAQDGVDTDGLRDTNKRLEAEQKRLADELRAHEERVAADVQAAQGAERTRTLFLSATPFASHFALDYAEGYLFSYPAENESTKGGWSHVPPRSEFFVTNFGYRIRYGKLTRPDAEVNSAIMEVEFNERLKREGAISGRALVSDRDYSRDFILIDDAVGAKIDEGIEWLREQAKDSPGYSALYEQLQKQFDYLTRMRLLEAIKARHALPIIQKHLAMGRKVYVMHDYIDGGGFHPFRFASARSIEVAGEQIDLAEVIRDFNKARPDLVGLDLSQLQSPLAVLGGALGDKLLQYNGRQPRKYLEEAKRAFNRDGGDQNVMLIQRQKGKAGISLHDTTGQHQRVMIDLGIPGRATDAIQGEGRGYRVGVQSDLPILYMTTATSFENFAFAHKTAERSGTAENLGMGSLARGLRDSILAAYQSPIEGYEPHDGEGKGGKARDRELAVANALSPFERSKTFYFGQQKNTKRRDQREGADYFATPEPVGFKMVEWANLQPGEPVLEPSAGHGAIARFFPESAKRVLIEPSMRLASKAGLSAPGAEVINDDFESHHVVNKYAAIVMNPPYGMGGKTAAEHVAKAIKHLRDGGRVVALIPEGPSADKRFETLLEETPHVYQVGSVSLPRVTFERAGTQVKTRVLVLEKQETEAGRDQLQPSRDVDLSSAESISELFDRLENIGMRDRVLPAAPERAAAPAQDKPAKQSYAEKAAIAVEKYVTDAPIIEHTTGKGKLLRGVIVTDMTLEQVKERLDKYAFKKDGGVFVRQEYIQRPDAESRYSLRASEIDQFIDRVSNTRNPRISQVVGETPAVFELLGEQKLPVQLRSGVVLKALGGKHELTADQLKQALAQLNDPVMVFDSNTEAGSMVTLTEVRDNAGRAVVVALHFEQQAGRHVLHDIATVHGRNSDQHMIHWIRQGLLAYRNKKTSRSWLQSVPLQLRWEGVRNDQRGRVYTESDLSATGAGYRLTYGAVKAIPPFRVKALGQKLRTAGLPVEVVASEAQLPADLQEQIRRDGASGRVEGTYHNGVAYLVASNLSSDKRAMEVALHEVVGHGGVRSVLGERIEGVMAQVYRDMPADRRQVIESDYAEKLAGLSETEAQQEVAEEYLAHLAETDPRNGLVAKLIGMLRNWLRQVFGDKLAMQWTREDLVELLASARREVRRGAGSDSGTLYSAELRASDLVRLYESAYADDGKLQYGSSESDDLGEIVADVMRNPDFVVESRRMEVPKGGARLAPAAAGFVVKRPRADGSHSTDLYVFDAESERPFFEIGGADGERGMGGMGLYLAGMTWAARNDKHLRPDPRGISHINRLRRTEAMIASILREGSSAHLEPHRDQYVGLLDEALYQRADDPNGTIGDYTAPAEALDALKAKLWRDEKHGKTEAERLAIRRANLNNLIVATTALAHRRAPELHNYSVDSQGRLHERVYSGDSAERSAARQTPSMGDVAKRIADRHAPDGVGRSTVRRAAAAQSLLPHAPEKSGNPQESDSQLRRWRQSLQNFGAESGAPRAARGLLPDVVLRRLGQAGADSNAYYSLTPSADREALRKLGLSGSEANTLAEKIRAAFEGDWRAQLRDLGKRTTEGLFDGLAGIKAAEEAVGVADADQSGYVSARLASGLADVMHGVLHYGAPEWKDGIIQPRDGTRGLLDVLGDLGAEQLTDWLGWLGGKRAQLLMRQGRENNLSAAEIDELLALAKGREQLFERTYQEYAKLNDAVLDLAQEAGLIGAESRQKWLTDYYVPFYRSTDGEGLFGAPRSKRGLSHQSAAIKALRGGEVPTNDLLENMLTAWSKRIDASMKNKALLEVVDNLKESDYLSDESVRYTQAIIPRSEIAKRVKADRKTLAAVASMLGMQEGADAIEVAGELMKPENEGFEKLWALTAPTDPDIIRVQRDGKNEYYRVNDPALLRSVKAMSGSQFNDPVTRIGRWFKRLLTTGVTASPDFIARNFIRDAAHAWMINKDGFTFGVDSLKGLAQAVKEDPDYQALMFAGASFQGGYVHGSDPEASAQIIRRALEKKGLSAGQRDAYIRSLVTSPAQLGSALNRGWQKYRELGDKVENANRLSTYKAALAAGKSKRQAAFEAKDLMDYSLRGNFAAMVWFTDVVPFLNARLQGLYKLGRAMKGDRSLIAKEVAVKGLYLALFSLLLAGLNDDDDRYKELAEWDKDANWHIFLGDEHFRIPKPFELGLLFGTVPERMLHLASGSQDLEQFGWSLRHGITGTLAFNPIPQFYNPLREVQANRNFFFDKPIESMADEGKLAEARYDEHTSLTMRGLGKLTGPLADLSPKQLQHLWEGYTGTLGAYALWAADQLVAPFHDGRGERPAMDASDMPVLRSFYRGDRPRSTQYHTDLYDMMGEVEQLARTVKSYQAEGLLDEAERLAQDSRDKLRHRRALGFARQQLGAIRKRMQAIHRSTSMSGEQKRAELDRLQLRSNALATRIVERVRGDF